MASQLAVFVAPAASGPKLTDEPLMLLPTGTEPGTQLFVLLNKLLVALPAPFHSGLAA